MDTPCEWSLASSDLTLKLFIVGDDIQQNLLKEKDSCILELQQKIEILQADLKSMNDKNEMESKDIISGIVDIHMFFFIYFVRVNL